MQLQQFNYHRLRHVDEKKLFHPDLSQLPRSWDFAQEVVVENVLVVWEINYPSIFSTSYFIRFIEIAPHTLIHYLCLNEKRNEIKVLSLDSNPWIIGTLP